MKEMSAPRSQRTFSPPSLGISHRVWNAPETPLALQFWFSRTSFKDIDVFAPSFTTKLALCATKKTCRLCLVSPNCVTIIFRSSGCARGATVSAQPFHARTRISLSASFLTVSCIRPESAININASILNPSLITFRALLIRLRQLFSVYPSRECICSIMSAPDKFESAKQW